MRGIILAGGMGTRLLPLTQVANKHALPIYDKPMCHHLVGYLKDAGVTNIMVVTGREHCGDLISILGSGKDFGVELTYRVQDEADGIVGALRLCEDFAKGEPVVVILGDNLLENGIKPLIDKYRARGSSGGQVAVIRVEDPQRFGVATLDKEGRVIRIVEKPKNPETNLAVIGVYMYDSRVWKLIPTLQKSKRGEYEITDVNNAYIQEGTLFCETVEGWWHDAGTIESMFDATVLMHAARMKEKANGRGE